MGKMNKWARTCSVIGCVDSDSPRHRFPMPTKDKALYVKWLEATGNLDLKRLPCDLVYRSHRVCDIHFAVEDKLTNQRLKRNVYPTLFCGFRTNTGKKITPIKNVKVSQGISKDIPSTSSTTLQETIYVCDHDYLSREFDVQQEPPTDVVAKKITPIENVKVSQGISKDIPSTSSTTLQEIIYVCDHDYLSTEFNVQQESPTDVSVSVSENFPILETPKRKTSRNRKYSFNNM